MKRTSIPLNGIVASDFHFTSETQDAYRFDIIPWLVDQATDYLVDDIFILGDLTEKKDKHPSILVNNIVDLLRDVPQRVTILKGNHDGLDPDHPYFEFLNVLPNVRFIKDVTFTKSLGGCKILFIPHGNHLGINYQLSSSPDLIMAHVTVRGSVDFTGRELSGLDLGLDHDVPVLAGDVHKAQVVGKVEYIGVPYDVKFGDRSTRSAIVFKDGYREDLKFPGPRKRTIVVTSSEDLEDVKGKSGDFVRVVIEMTPDTVGEANETRAKVEQLAEARGFLLDGVQIKLTVGKEDGSPVQLQHPHEAFQDFCIQHHLSDEIIAFGRKCLPATT